MNKPTHSKICYRRCARIFTFSGAVIFVLVLSGCASTAQQDDRVGQSIPGRPMPGGAGGAGGGSGGGTGLGNASGGAGGGLNTAASAAPPEAVGAPSMPQDGSKPNPVPTASSRSATGMTTAETGTAPESALGGAGAATARNANGGEASGIGPDGALDGAGNTKIDGATDALDQAGAEISAADASGQNSDETGSNNGELADVGEGSDAAGAAEDGTGSDDGEGQDDALAGAPGGASATTASVDGIGGNDPNASRAGTPGGAAAIGATGAIGGAAPTTLDERRAAIRGRVDASFAVIDGLTLAERERVQRAANAGGFDARRAAGTGAGNADNEEDGGGGDGTGQRSVVIVANNSGVGGGTMPAGTAGRLGNFDNENADVTYPIPTDIPSGDDDDVVARQLREAALHEADPDLREKLWDEYREYTSR